LSADYEKIRDENIARYSSDEHFRIENYVRPFSADPLDEPVPGTLFVFPFDHDTISAAMAVAEISSALTAIEPATLLFLSNIECVRIRGAAMAGSVLERATITRTSAAPRCCVEGQAALSGVPS